jgi:hypothetical protein
MRLSPLILLLILLPFTLFARTVSVPPLPGSPYADTEVSTNIAFQVDTEKFNRLEFSLRLDRSASNSLEIAIGKDTDLNGILSLDETDMDFGCDCGNWFIRSSDDDSIKWETVQGSFVRDFVLRKSEMKSDWNLVKITRRGEGVSSDVVAVRQLFLGLQILVQ